MNHHPELGTRDIHIAAYLVAKGHKLVRTEGTFSRLEFVFAGVSPADLVAYFHPDTVLSPRLFADALRGLKGLISSGDRR